MSPTWHSDEPFEFPPLTALDHARFLLRLLLMGPVTFGGLALLLVLRLVERPLFGTHRPVTPLIAQAVCRANCAIMGLAVRVRGRPLAEHGAMVANHVSWLDIFVLNARSRLYFVAKSEVAGWAGIGWLARATGTVFVERRRHAAKAQRQIFHDRLAQGHKLMFFPEGTSTDGRRVLEFKSTLFDAFFDEAHRQTLWIQPVTQVYRPPEGADPRFYGWWGTTDFGPHFRMVLAAARQGSVEVIYHPPVRIDDHADRKALARRLGETVRAGLLAELPG